MAVMLLKLIAALTHAALLSVMFIDFDCVCTTTAATERLQTGLWTHVSSWGAGVLGASACVRACLMAKETCLLKKIETVFLSHRVAL